MDRPMRHIKYRPGTRCAAPGCTQLATQEVYLYDLYNTHGPSEFFEQDYTCPYLCDFHVQENEAKAVGARVARGDVKYPYSNRHRAQGFTKYAPIAELVETLVDSTVLTKPGAIVQFTAINRELIEYLSRHPELMREMNQRTFEELVAEIFRNQGFDVTLTPRTRDGGRDVQAAMHNSLGRFLYYVECKRYAETNHVGVGVVRELYGVVMQENVTHGVIATTSTFTTDAIRFAEPIKYRLSLRDFEALTVWLSEYLRTPP